ncbi:MAG: TolC family outer membrane protein [Gammaproteobacteria bacterium]
MRTPLAPSALAQELDSQRVLPALDAPAALEPLELAQAVHLAVDRHPSIADAIATLAQQSGSIDVARAGYYPVVHVGVGKGDNNGFGISDNGSVATASMSQMLYDFGKVSGSVDQAEALVRRQQALVLKQIDTIAQQTANAVVMVHRYQALLGIAREQVVSVEKVLETAQLRARAGVSARADAIQAETRVDSARANLLQVQALHMQWRERLRTLIGGAVPAFVAPLPDQLANELNVNAPPDPRLLPDVLAAEAERRTAAAQLEAARAQRLPTISLDASVNKAIDGINPNTLERYGTYHSVMLNFSTTLYQGGALNAQVRSAVAAERAARIRIETARLDASDQARNFREQVLGAQARLGVLAERKRSIQETRDLYFEQYTLGTRSILDLLNAEQEIYQAAADEEAVNHDLWESRVGYIGAVGQGRELYRLNNTTVQGMRVLP